uniref:Methylenetetrahydrofolate reductase (NAD(P)H) n=1 Tax=Aureoumbra lagunensis TaxID=44058 RepID=A0A7S3JT31_9STRA|mmetsp:Transcript_15737/g.23677  ORF Transcript_15737/g.23677 Transcript_15737/m.23677 type:complete len:374 (+) Transcript_15737:102-1223(+)
MRGKAFWQLVEALSRVRNEITCNENLAHPLPVQRLMELGKNASIEIAPSSAEQIPRGSVCQVYVNMVKKDLAHFDEVAASVQLLSERNFWTVAHVPASRFIEREIAKSIMRKLEHSGANALLLLAGNDANDFDSSNEFPHIAMTLLPLLPEGIRNVCVTGYPERGHNTQQILATKCQAVHAARCEVCVVSQFTLDPRHLIHWLDETRTQLADLSVRYRIGIPGPTPLKTLHRVAQICQVPTIQQDEYQLQLLEAILGIDRAAILTYSHQLSSSSLRNLAIELCNHHRTDESIIVKRQSSTFTSGGPSTFVSNSIATEEGAVFLPTDQILALAHYCDRTNVRPDEVALHFYPFGCISSTLQLIADLREGKLPNS